MIVLIRELSSRTFAKGKCWFAKDRESRLASWKVTKAHFSLFFMTWWPMVVKLWNKREQSLMFVFDCNLHQLTMWGPEFPERSAKAPRKTQWSKSTSPPAESPWGHTLAVKTRCFLSSFFSCPPPPPSLLSSFHFLPVFLSSSSGGRMRCVKRRWANALPTHANARLNQVLVWPYRLFPFTAKGPRKRLL